MAAGESVLSEMTEESTYTYVKGGRFSKKNVRKRMKDDNTAAVPAPMPTQEFEDEEDPIVSEKSTKGLTIAVFALLAAIVAVVIYLAVRFFMPNLTPAPAATIAPSTAVPTTTAAPTVQSVPCTDLKLDDTDVLLTFVGDSWRIDAVALPSDTTDMIQFFSSNESVATVSASGEIRAVGEGSAVITVVCGDVSKECFVNCTVETVPPETTEPVVTEPVTEPTEPVTEPTTPPTEPTQPSDEPTAVHTSAKTGKYTIRINGKACDPYDVTISVGYTFTITLVDSYGNKQDVTWSANNSNVSVNGNKITGVSTTQAGTYISCVINGEMYKCIVRVTK